MSSIMTANVYTYDELDDDAKQRVLDNWQRMVDASPYTPWEHEIKASVRETIEALGYQMKDWSIGAYGHSYITAQLQNDENGWREVDSLTGKRALAYYENALDSYRVPWKGATRRNLAKYGYRPGTLESTPFTGYYLDDVCLAHVKNRLIKGDTVREAIESLASVWRTTLEEEWEYARSLENLLEAQDGCLYYSDGTTADMHHLTESEAV